MQVSEIQSELHSYFLSHKYQLCNSYVFNWECDFFSISNSGYAYEIEIKVSRSDFFADFKKEKHVLFQKQLQGVAGYWSNEGKSWQGSNIGIVRYKKLEGGYRYGKKKDDIPGVVYDHNKQLYITNQWQHYDLHEHIMHLQAQATSIRYIDLTKINFPNRFYYCCPKDLIKVSEIPKYAGLYHVNNSGIEIIKHAPLLTKRIMDLKSVLLDKFYYECLKLRTKTKMI
jgi:hypothetical protein